MGFFVNGVHIAVLPTAVRLVALACTGWTDTGKTVTGPEAPPPLESLRRTGDETATVPSLSHMRSQIGKHHE